MSWGRGKKGRISGVIRETTCVTIQINKKCIPKCLPVLTHQIVHSEEVVVDVHVVALEPPDDLPEAGKLVHDRCQARGAPTPTHHHAPVHLGRLPDLDFCG